MYLYNPGLKGVIVLDSLNHKKKIIENETLISSVVTVDEYGRRIKPTIAPDGTKLAPQDSIITNLIFRTGKRLCNLIPCFFAFQRENEPGNYKVYFKYTNEEYNRIKGPVLVEIRSTELNYRIREYSKEELKIRGDVRSIIWELKNNSDSSSIYNLFSGFKHNYPKNIYIPQIAKSLEMHFHLGSLRKK